MKLNGRQLNTALNIDHSCTKAEILLLMLNTVDIDVAMSGAWSELVTKNTWLT